MPTSLTKRERAIAAGFRRYERQKAKAENEYAKATRLATTLAQKIFKMRQARQIGEFERAVRISEDSHVIATAQYLKAQNEVQNGGEALIWAHASVKPFALKTTNKLD